MKVFISYGSAADQVTALRLQALANVNGLTVYVPPAYTRDLKSLHAEQSVKNALLALGTLALGLLIFAHRDIRLTANADAALYHR
jgi:hypothetical protein